MTGDANGDAAGEGTEIDADRDAETELDGESAVYVFGVTVELEPDEPGVWADPDRFETTVYRRADRPGEPGWLYFRDNLWHGECTDEAHMRSVTEAALDARVSAVEFRELRTTRAYLEALRETIAEDLTPFNAAGVDEVLSKYIGSSIRLVDDDEGNTTS